MKKNIRYILGIFIVFLLTILSSCTQETYTMGDLKAPTNVTINTEIVGQNAESPNGDGSGDVKIAISGDNALGYKISYDATVLDNNGELKLDVLPSGIVTKNYPTPGVKTYRITVIVTGIGGSITTVTKDITVRSDFTAAPEIITALTNNATKTWVVDKSAAGHFGVGPYTGSVKPEWWAASPNEKEASAPGFYTASFTFAKVTATNTYSLTVATPDGAFTKTGSLTTLPGIPATGAEGCYSYSGGTSAFIFVPASSGISADVPSTKTSMLLSGVDTFIGYGALLKEYEIMSISSTNMYLRVQGTETGNAWYIKLKPAL